MFTIKNNLSKNTENSKGDKKTNVFLLTDELNWFNATSSSSPRSECDAIYARNPCRKKIIPKTKFIISIKKDYDMKYLEELINEGGRIFKIDSALFTLKEYSNLIVKIQNIFHKLNDIPTIVFDLKGPIRNFPVVNKKQQTLKMKESKIVRISTKKCFGDDHIQIDKIPKNIKIGDELTFENSTIKLEVKDLKLKRPRTKSVEDKKGQVLFENSRKVTKYLPNTSRNNIESKLDHDLSSIWEKSFGDDSIYDNEILHCLLNFSSIPVLSQFQKLSNDFNEIINKYKMINSCNDSSVDHRNEQCLREFRHKPRQIISTPKNSSQEYDEIICLVKEEGLVRANEHIVITKHQNRIANKLVESVINAEDMLDIKNIISLGVQIISCRVNNSHNLDDLHQIINETLDTKPVKIIARIETQEAIFNFDSILEKCDGVIIAHGLFPCEISFVDLCLIENYIVEKCKRENKFLFLQSSVSKGNNFIMMNNKPLMSELSSIEHAIHNNFDGIIINEDIHSEKSNDIVIIKDILFQFERNITLSYSNEVGEKPNLQLNPLSQSIFHSSVKAANELKAGLIIFYSNKLKYLKDLTKFVPPCSIIFPTFKEEEMTVAQLIKGVLPYKWNANLNVDEVTKEIIRTSIDSRMIHKDDHVIVIIAFENFDTGTQNGMYLI